MRSLGPLRSSCNGRSNRCHPFTPTLVDALQAAKKTVTALSDFKTTTKVKAALLGDELTAHSHIPVSTVAGVVTLSGNILSPYVAARAEQLA